MNKDALRRYLIQEELKKHYSVSELISRASLQIKKYTPQLYRKRSNEKPIDLDAHASAILVKISEYYFLITAGHVYRENNNPIPFDEVGVLCENTFIVLEGEIAFADPSLSEINDKIDISVLKLNDEVVKVLSKFHDFLDFKDIDYSHSIVTSPSYLLYGYPVNRSKKRPDQGKIIVNPFSFTTRWSGVKKQQRMNLELHSHVALDFQRRRIFSFDDNKRKMGPLPYGISGSGVWYLPRVAVKKGEEVPVKLVGLLTEWDNFNSAVIGTRIHIITETIRQKFSVNIPVSHLTKVNL